MFKAIPAAALIVAASAAAGGMMGGQAPAGGRDRINERYRVYTAALADIEQQYV